MAHEIGHHVHRHLLKASRPKRSCCSPGSVSQRPRWTASWRWLGLASAADPAGMPVLVLSWEALLVAATPLVNAWSRAHERRADRFALETASEPAAFIRAVRRMSAHNSQRIAHRVRRSCGFHTHPTAEERIAAARDVLEGTKRKPRVIET
jgi:Zn-dependent protease with chaperone function